MNTVHVTSSALFLALECLVFGELNTNGTMLHEASDSNAVFPVFFDGYMFISP